MASHFPQRVSFQTPSDSPKIYPKQIKKILQPQRPHSKSNLIKSRMAKIAIKIINRLKT